MTYLEDQIMDQLMDGATDRPMTIAAIADALASGYENTRRKIRGLERRGLIYAHSAVYCSFAGRPQIAYAMERTNRRKAA